MSSDLASDCDLSSTDTSSNMVEISQVDFAKILQVHYTDLRALLNVKELIPLMRKHELLTAEECQDLLHKPGDAEKIDQLVHILPRKGKLAYPKFIKCLKSEKQHLGHPEIVLKLKETAGKLKCQQPNVCPDINTSQETAAVTSSAAFAKQFYESLLARFAEKDNTIERLAKKIAILEAQIRQKDKVLSNLQSHSSHAQLYAVSDVAKFQQLLNYVNGGHGSQLSPGYDTRTTAKHYQHLRSIMKNAKHCLKQDAEYVCHCINTTSEDSDGIRSRTSSLDSESQLHGAKMSKVTELSIEVVKEFEEESAEESADGIGSGEDSYSSADETDDEMLDTTLEPEIEHQIVHRLKSQQHKRPESWIAYKERRASKGVSRYSISSTTQARKGSTTDSDANDDKLPQETLVTGAVAASGEVEHEKVDINLACSNVELSSIDGQEESVGTMLTGYLHKEGTGPHDNRWKKRYFTLTKEYLYYSKSQQDTRSTHRFPLIGLALERKKKNIFEVINKQASNIKVDKPGKRHVLIANSKVIKLKASSETEALKWIRSIDDAIAKLRSQFSLTHTYCS